MSTRRRQNRPRRRPLNQVRIIGGEWRSRRLEFPPEIGVRPSGDRIRETLFNWLSPWIHGSRCLDAFAGSGALGFEALSRGAREVTFLDSNERVCAALHRNSGTLQAPGVRILQTDTLQWLKQPPEEPFDIIFLDPPFAENLHARCLAAIAGAGLCHEESLVYVESPADAALVVPAEWETVREKRTGNLDCRLVRQLRPPGR